MMKHDKDWWKNYTAFADRLRLVSQCTKSQSDERENSHRTSMWLRRTRLMLKRNLLNQPSPTAGAEPLPRKVQILFSRFAYSGSETCVLSDTEVECESWKVGIGAYMRSQSIGGVSDTTRQRRIYESVPFLWRDVEKCPGLWFSPRGGQEALRSPPPPENMN